MKNKNEISTLSFILFFFWLNDYLEILFLRNLRINLRNELIYSYFFIVFFSVRFAHTGRVFFKTRSRPKASTESGDFDLNLSSILGNRLHQDWAG